MGFGSNGAILRIDLTADTSTVETFDEAFYRRYPGGKALAAYHRLRQMPASADPLGPDNVLVLADADGVVGCSCGRSRHCGAP